MQTFVILRLGRSSAGGGREVYRFIIINPFCEWWPNHHVWMVIEDGRLLFVSSCHQHHKTPSSSPQEEGLVLLQSEDGLPRQRRWHGRRPPEHSLALPRGKTITQQCVVLCCFSIIRCSRLLARPAVQKSAPKNVVFSMWSPLGATPHTCGSAHKLDPVRCGARRRWCRRRRRRPRRGARAMLMDLKGLECWTS